ncbi:MAG: hypothetical protein JWP52_3332 [Rhizobacter sp.]|nr:hypothetical protein [Rhizobacter sp.]
MGMSLATGVWRAVGLSNRRSPQAPVFPIGRLSMTTSNDLFRRATAAATAGSLLSTAVLVNRSHRELKNAAIGVNCISHWIHGEAAFDERRWNVPHTAVGFAIHHLSSVLWGFLYVGLIKTVQCSALTMSKRRSRPGPAEPRLLNGGATDKAAMRSPAQTSPHQRAVPPLICGAAAVAGIAAFTDLRLVPHRLSPGFQQHLGRGSVTLVYVAFAVGLAAAELWRYRHERRPPAGA